MMPSPRQNTASGDPAELPGRPEPAPPAQHLTCECQREAVERRSLCGLPVQPRTPAERSVEPPPAGSARREWCVVCVDLAHAAREAGRCGRCPS
jgi:hypothetical protein